jgi:hypothetical protein
LHEKREEVIAELYGNLDKIAKAIHSVVHRGEWAGEPSKDQKEK